MAAQSIHEAIAAGDEDRLTAAIMTELDMHVKAEALVESVRHGQMACVRALLREGCDPCLKHAGRTALYWAVRLDNAAMLHLLLDDLLLLLDDGICLPKPRTSQLHRLHLPPPPPPHTDTPLKPPQHDDVFTDDNDVLEKRALFPDGPAAATDTDSTMDSPSEAVAQSVMAELPEDTPATTATAAAPWPRVRPRRRTKEDKMRLRAQRAINEALFEAASHGSSQCMDVLLASHADPNAYFYHDDEFLSWSPPLLAACFAPVYCQQRRDEERCLAVVQSLVSHGADIGNANCFGDTALHWAAVAGIPAVVLLLLRNGADINRQNSYGRTPLHCAIEHDAHNAGAVAGLLVQWGAGLHLTDKDGWTALLYAVERKNLDTAALLLESGASPDQPRCPVTPLDMALATEDVSMLRLLLSWHVTVTASQATMALDTRNPDIVAMMLAAGAQRHLQGMVDAPEAGAVGAEDTMAALRHIITRPLSLKQHARLTIRSRVPRPSVQLLPLPGLLKDFLLFSDL